LVATHFRALAISNSQVVIDRGSYPGAVLMSVFTDGTFLTTIEVGTTEEELLGRRAKKAC
jgi:hypothetical protein